MGDQEERTDNDPGAIRGSAAHRVRLKELIALREKGLEDRIQSYGLTDQQKVQVREIIQEIMSEPCFSHAQVIELLEDLLVDQGGSLGAIYMKLDDYRTMVTNQIAEKAFAEGLKVAK